MTRKVLIVNLSDGPILARLRVRRELAEKYLKNPEPDTIVHAEFLGPQTTAEFFLHPGVGLMLDEDDEGKLAPPVP